MNIQNFVSLSNNQVITTSKQVSHIFGRRHEYVIKKIKDLTCSDEFKTDNFSEQTCKHEQNGEIYIHYEMTKDGFMFLVMGFTGQKAAQIKEAYINAFNAMAEQLQSNEPKRTFSPDDIVDVGEPLSIGRHTFTPTVTPDGRMWLTHYQLNDLLGYTQRNAVKSIFGRNVDKYEPHQYAHYVFEDDHGHHRKHFIIESSAWIKTAALAQGHRMTTFINVVSTYLANEVAISKADWEQLQQQSEKGEAQYRLIAQKSNELMQAVSDAQMPIGMTKILTQKH